VTAQPAAAAWTAARLGDLAEQLADLEAAHGALRVGDDRLGDLTVRLVGVMEHLAADLYVPPAAPIRRRRPGRPGLRLIHGGGAR
jgi:hypothetical protein